MEGNILESDATDLLFVDTFPGQDVRLQKNPNTTDKWITLLNIPKFYEETIDLERLDDIEASNYKQRERETVRRLDGIAWHGGLEELDENYHIYQFAQKYFIRERILREIYEAELKKPRMTFKPLRPMISSLNENADPAIFFGMIKQLLDFAQQTLSVEFLLAATIGLLHALKHPEPIPIREQLKLRRWSCSHANFPVENIVQFEIGVSLKGDLSISSDGTYLYVLTNNQVHKIGTLKSTPGIVYGTYNPTEKLVCVAFYPALNKLLCLVSADPQTITIWIIDPDTMEKVDEVEIGIVTQDFQADSCWLACNEWFACYGINDGTTMKLSKIELFPKGKKYTGRIVDFSEIHGIQEYPKIQFWISEKQLIYTSYPCDGRLHKIRLSKDKQESTRIADEKEFSTLCVDLYNNCTWALPPVTNEGRVTQGRNHGFESYSYVASAPSNFLTFLISNKFSCLGAYLQQFSASEGDEIDPSSALTYLLGFLDVKTTRFCSHTNAPKSAQDCCIELSQNIFQNLCSVLEETSRLAIPIMHGQTSETAITQEVMWLLSILKLLRVHFIRAVDFNVDKIAVSLFLDDKPSPLALNIQKILEQLLDATASGTTESMRLVALEASKAYSQGLPYFYPETEDRFKFIRELLPNVSQPREHSKRILMEEVCDSISESLLFDSLVIFKQKRKSESGESTEEDKPESINNISDPKNLDPIPQINGPNLQAVGVLYLEIGTALFTSMTEQSITNQEAVFCGNGLERQLPSKLVKIVINVQKQILGLTVNSFTRKYSWIKFVIKETCRYLDALQESIPSDLSEPECEQKILKCLENSIVMKIVPNFMLNVNLLKACKNKFIEKMTKVLKHFVFTFQSVRAIEESVVHVTRNPIQVVETPQLTRGRPEMTDTAFNINEQITFPEDITSVVAHCTMDRGTYSISEHTHKRYTEKPVPVMPITINDRDFTFCSVPAQRPVSGSRIMFVGYKLGGDALKMDHITRHNTPQFLYDLLRLGSHLLTQFVYRLVGDALIIDFEKFSDLFIAGGDTTPADAPTQQFIDQIVSAEENTLGDNFFRALKGNTSNIGGNQMEAMDRNLLAVLLKHNNLIEEAIHCAQTTTQPTVSLQFLWKTVMKMRHFIIQTHQQQIEEAELPEQSDNIVSDYFLNKAINLVVDDCRGLLRFAPKSHLQLKSFLEPFTTINSFSPTEDKKSLKRSNTVLLEDNEPASKKAKSLNRSNSSPLKTSTDGLEKMIATVAPRPLRTSMEIENTENANTEANPQAVKSLIRSESTMTAIHKWKLGANAAPQVTQECQNTCNIILQVLQTTGREIASWVMPMQFHRATRKIDGFQIAAESIMNLKFPSMKNEMITRLISVSNYRLDLQLVEGPPLLDVRNSFWTLLETVMTLLTHQSQHLSISKGKLLLLLGSNFSPLIDLSKLHHLGVIKYLFNDIQQSVENEIQTKKALAEVKAAQCVLLAIMQACLFGGDAKAITTDAEKYVDEHSYNTLKELLQMMQTQSIEMLHHLLGVFIRKGFQLHQQKQLGQRNEISFQNFEKTLFSFLQSLKTLVNNPQAAMHLGLQFVGDLLPLCALGSLRCSRGVLRILRKLLPNTAPSVLDDYLHHSKITNGTFLPEETPLSSFFNIGPANKEKVLEKLMLEIGKTLKLGDTHTNPLITTGRSYLAVQSELVMLTRLLAKSASWRDIIVSFFSSNVDTLDQLLKGKTPLEWTPALGSSLATLLVFGGHTDILRVGGRCKVNWDDGQTDTGTIFRWDVSSDASYRYPHPFDVVTLSEIVPCINADLLLDSCTDGRVQTIECIRLTPITEIPADPLILMDADVIPTLLKIATKFKDVPSCSPIRSQACCLLTGLLFNFFSDPKVLTKHSTIIKKTGFAGTLMKMALEIMPIEQNRYYGLDTPLLEAEMCSVLMQLRDMACDSYQIAVPFVPRPEQITDCFTLPETTTDPQLVVPQLSGDCDEVSFWGRALLSPQQQIKIVSFLVKLHRQAQHLQELQKIPGILFGMEGSDKAGICFLDEESSLITHQWVDVSDVIVLKGSLYADPRIHRVPFNPKLLMEEATKCYQSLSILYAREILLLALAEPQLDIIPLKYNADKSNLLRLIQLVIGKKYPLSSEKKPEVSSNEKNIVRLIQDLGMEAALCDVLLAFFPGTPWTFSIETPHPVTEQINHTYKFAFPKAVAAFIYSDINTDSTSFSLMGKDCCYREFRPPSTLYYTDYIELDTETGPGYGYKLYIFPLGCPTVDRASLSTSSTNVVMWLFSIVPEYFPDLFAKMVNLDLMNGLLDYCNKKGSADLYLTAIKCLTCALHVVLDEVKKLKPNSSKHWFTQIESFKLESLLTLYLTKTSREEVEICVVLAKAKKLLSSKVVEKLKKKRSKKKKVPIPPPDNYPSWLPCLMGISTDVLTALASPTSREVSPEWLNEVLLDLIIPLQSWETPHPYPSKPEVKTGSLEFYGAEMIVFRFDERSHIAETDSLVLGPDLETSVCFLMGGENNSVGDTGKYSKCRGNKFEMSFEVKEPIHPNTCTSCEENEGTFWNCLHCKTWFCSTHVDEHDPSHVFAKYRRPREEEPPCPVIQPIQWEEDHEDHPGTQCANCNTTPITGTRYKCGYCGISLCAECENEEAHTASHVLIRLPHPIPADIEDTLVHQATQQDYFGVSFIVQPVYPKHIIEEIIQKNKKKVNQYKKYLEGWTLEEDIGLLQFVDQLICPIVVSAENITSDLVQELTTTSNEFLRSMPIEKVQARYAFLRHLNRHLESLFVFIPYGETMSPPSLPWSLTHQLRAARSFIFPEIKTNFLNACMAKECTDQGKEILLNRDLSTQTVGIFKQAFWQLEADDYSYLRMPPDLPAFKATFIGEGSEDVGGPFGEALTTIFMESQTETPTRKALFIPCPNNTTEVGLNRDKVIPNSSVTSPAKISAFKFIGALMATCFRCSVPCPLNLPSLFWKKFVGEKVDRSDLLAIDQTCIQSLDSLINIEQEGITREQFSDAISFTFTTTTSDGRKVSLIEGGADIPVTWENRIEYARLVEEYKLSEFDRQIKTVLAGFTSVMGSTDAYFTLCTWEEIELRICGKPEIDINILMQNTEYHGYTRNDEVILNFWAAMGSFTQETLGAFVRFTSGRTRLPHVWQRNFRLTKLRVDKPDEYLPTAHTCFFQLELPEYSSSEILREKLLYAVTECKAIDLDFRVRDEDI